MLDLWQLYQSGLFCFSAVFPYEKGISYLFLVHFFSEAISFLARLYGSLGYSAELLSVQLSMRNTENVPLIETPSANRNFEFICRIPEISLHLERTETLEEITHEMGMVVAEGVKTAISAHMLAQRKNCDTPIINAVFNVLYNNLSAGDAVRALMTRDARDEED